MYQSLLLKVLTDRLKIVIDSLSLSVGVNDFPYIKEGTYQCNVLLVTIFEKIAKNKEGLPSLIIPYNN